MSAFQSIGVQDGLSNLVVLAIGQDDDGALWIGTDDGLFRLDGTRAVHVGRGPTAQLHHIEAIEPAPGGGMCVIVEAALWCGRGDAFGRRALPAPVHGLTARPGELWAVTEDGLYDARAEPATRVALPLRAPPRYAVADAHGLIVGNDAELAARDAAGRWRTRALPPALADDPPLEARWAPSGAVWLRGTRRVWRVGGDAPIADPISGPVDEVTHDVAPIERPAIGGALAISPTGEVALATAGGLARFTGAGWDMLDRARGLPTTFARVAYFDRRGELWLGSAGVHRLLGRGLIERYTPDTGLPGETAWSLLRARTGELYVGTDRCLARAAAAGWACVPGTVGVFVRAIAEHPDGTLYFGGRPSTVYELPPGGEVRPWFAIAPGRGAPLVLAIAVGADGAVWLATDAGIWHRAADATGPPVAIAPPGGDPRRFVASIALDGDRVWFAGYEGLRVVEHGAWRRFTAADGLRATALRYVLRRADGRLCVQYDEGLGTSCFRYHDGQLTAGQHIDGGSGLDPTMAYAMGEDARGRLWLGTGAGLRVVDDDPRAAIDRFTSADGLAGDDSAAMAFLRDADGALWFGATGGLSRIDGARYAGPPLPPSVRVLALHLGGAPPTAAGEPDPDAAGGHDLDALFTATTADTGSVEYRVRLLPAQPAWGVSASPAVRYGELAPGDYALELGARVHRGAWGPTTQLRVVIPPAWWQRRAVRGAAALLGLAVVAAAVLAWQRAALRRRTRALTVQTDASFRAYVEAMPDVVIVRGADGATYRNAAARAVIGDREVGALPWLLRAVHPDDRARAAALLRRGRTGSEVVELRLGRDDHWRDLEVTLQPISLAGARAHVLVGRDVTERRRLQAKMRIADRMVSLGTLAAGIGHEINNPLTYLRANVELIGELLDDRPADDAIREAVRDALDGADRVRAIVRGLATFSQSTAERRVPVALHDVIEQATRLTHNELRHRAHLVVGGDAPPLVLADPRRLVQVLINLLINAAQAIPPGAAHRNQIDVRTGRDPDTGEAILEVEDRGVGMPPEVVARVFDPFFTTKQIGEGTGLGLSICHGVITSLGGRIAVASERDRGTTVRITLPAAPATAAEPSARAEGSPVTLPATRAPTADSGPVARAPTVDSGPIATGPRPRVLIVDDEPAVGEGVARMLRKHCDVTVLSDSEAALRLIAAGAPFDVIVTDVMMPVMTGLELYDRLAALDRDHAARVVFITGGAFTPATAERLEGLPAPRLEKPFSADEIRLVIARVATAAPPARAARTSAQLLRGLGVDDTLAGL